MLSEVHEINEHFFKKNIFADLYYFYTISIISGMRINEI